MPASAPRPARLSKEEWLELEKQTGSRYEYLDGFVYAMAGESRTHNDIVVNITLALAQKARVEGCRLQVENMRTWVKALNRYYYPDVVISCGTEAHESEIHEPCFIVEVLSETTADKDRREKLEAYFKIPTLETYVLVSQDEKRVGVYQRTRWNLVWSELINDGELEVACLGEALSLEQIYAGLAVAEVIGRAT
ncbi:Uma2 family endonuclease [Helicobacter pylori]|jgi:Uma2 family endonuclease|uniref:Uma2 family endonuclease n=1 Tax=Calidithermus timidus TaxID=307124 RepID=UPI0003789826|nr:Uma2 family endonuclease [Calidithermus timidus]MWR20502.1 Uma2 family endonuclease [Helicobacter pylori]